MPSSVIPGYSLSKLVRKKLHSDRAGETFAEGIDYRYNIRGWVTSINAASPEQPDSEKLFAMDVFYEEGLPELSSVPQFNGNVSAVKWRNADINEEQAYIYSYDGFDRLAAARYRTPGQPKDGAFDVCGFDGSSIAYDPNGNFSAVARHAFVNSARVEVDRLAYEYRGNQLKRVRDLSGRSEGFHDAGFEGDGYEYDASGNMVRDHNNGLQITYNSLNLIDMVTKQSGEWVRFGFDAVGQKRFRETSGPGSPPSVRLDYFGDYVFENGILRLVRHDEGQLVWDSDEEVWRYQYFVNDYLGNMRVAYEVEVEETAGGVAFHRTIIHVEDYYPFGSRIAGNQVQGTGGSAVKYLFGGKELQDVIGLDWYDFGARMLDSEIGRWFVLDPEAEKRPSVTPYGYTLNNPIRYVDLDGRQPAPSSDLVTARSLHDVVSTVSTAVLTGINLLAPKPLKGRPTIYFLESWVGGENPILFRGSVVDEPLAAAEFKGYAVKRISNANVWDLRSAVSDPNVVGIVTMSHGEGGELSLAASARPDPWGPVINTVEKGAVGPSNISQRGKSIVSPSLKFALLLGCDALMLGQEWSEALSAYTAVEGTDVYGYDYHVPAIKVWADSPIRTIFQKYGIIDPMPRVYVQRYH